MPADATNQQRKEYEASVKLYKKANGFAVTLLSTSVEDEPMQLIMMFKTAKEMWCKLAASYEQKSEQRLEHLYLELLEYKKDVSDSIATHISKLQKLWIELNEESWRIDTCRLPETLLIMRILSTLPEEYFEFRTTWESVPRDQRSIEYLLERLTMVEMRVSKRQCEVTPSSSSALVAKGHWHQTDVSADKKKPGPYNKNHGESTKPKKDYSKLRCYVCNEMGHTQYKCPKNSKKPSESPQQQNEALFSEALVAGESGDTDLWIADTGASHHMTKSKDFFVSYAAFPEPKPVTLGNHKLMLAYGQGNIQIETLVNNEWKKYYLKDVWYTPDVVKNLFSVPTAADKGLEYWLDQRSCRITKNGETVVVGKRHGGLYKLILKVIPPQSPAEVYVASRVDSLQVWHERLGHQNKQYVEKYLKKHGITYTRDNQLCEACILGKQHRLSFGTRMTTTVKPGELIHADVCGPMQEDSFRGYRYFVNFKDDFSKYRDVYFMKQKSEVAEKLKYFLAKVKTAGHTVKELLTDGGGEFDNKEVRQITQQIGLNHRMSMPYTPEQNGAAERENRTLVEAARSMLQSTKLPNKLWAEAVNTAAYILNRTGPTKVAGKSPYELWTGKEPSVDHLKNFGTECFVHVPKQKRQKLDPKSIKGQVVGYCGDDGYRIYVPVHNVITSRDVIFKEELPTSAEQTDSSNEETEADVKLLNEADHIQDCHDCEDSSRRTLRDRSQIQLPARYEDYAMFADYSEPNSYSEAMVSEDSQEWHSAMDEEMKSLAENNTWELVDKPDNRMVIANRWVYRVKTNLDGTVDKFKARLVAKGFSQQAGVDYNETFSPVARFDTIRAVLSVAASEKLNLAHFDVKTAFLYGELDEVIYMRQPTGYEDGTDRVCKLNKSLYGLKQAPRCWNRKFRNFLEKHGLQVSKEDPCLFYSTTESHKLIIALYVDDGLVAAENKDDLEQFLLDLRSEFCVTVSPLACFLGLQICQLQDGSISVSQENYTKKVLQRYNMHECNKVTTPIVKMTVPETDCCIKEKIPYREAVGSLMYLAVGTRPDIAFAVSTVSQALDKPTEADWQKVKHILKYLKGTSQIGIVYQAGHQTGVLTTYSDADYAGDISTRRSTSGVVCQYMGGPVAWLSQRQKSVALSTTEAEFMAASEAAKEIIWLSRLLSEITTLVATPVLKIDNMSAVKLVKNPTFHKRSKHIEVRHYFVREKFDEGRLTVEHISGEEQIADILTKPLQKNRFEQLRDMLGVKSG